jgi:hypothetical protein
MPSVDDVLLAVDDSMLLDGALDPAEDNEMILAAVDDLTLLALSWMLLKI